MASSRQMAAGRLPLEQGVQQPVGRLSNGQALRVTAAQQCCLLQEQIYCHGHRLGLDELIVYRECPQTGHGYDPVDI